MWNTNWNRLLIEIWALQTIIWELFRFLNVNFLPSQSFSCLLRFIFDTSFTENKETEYLLFWSVSKP